MSITGPWAISEDGLRKVMAAASKADARMAQMPMPASVIGYRVVDGTAIVPVSGPLESTPSPLGALLQASSYQAIGAAFSAAEADPAVSRIRLDIDSPGGSVYGCQALADRIATSAKPTMARISGMGCSAAYWLASAAGHIDAAPTAVVGSLGALQIVHPDADDLHVFRASLSPGKRAAPDSEFGAAQYQAIADDHGREFLGSVARYRGLDSAEAIAEASGYGAIFSGRAALAAGLVDSISVSASDDPMHFRPPGAQPAALVAEEDAMADEPMDEERPPAEAEAEAQGENDEDPLAAIEARVAELEAENAELRARLAEGDEDDEDGEDGEDAPADDEDDEAEASAIALAEARARGATLDLYIASGHFEPAARAQMAQNYDSLGHDGFVALMETIGPGRAVRTEPIGNGQRLPRETPAQNADQASARVRALAASNNLTMFEAFNRYQQVDPSGAALITGE